MKDGRDKWSSKLGFILAAAGSAVGLGNIWKFPYTLGTNGGGVFVLFYLIFLILIGFPLMVAAISLGRKSQQSVIGAYRTIDKSWSFVGVLGVVCGFFILAFYSAVGGWVVYYLKNALVGSLNIQDPARLEDLFKGFMNRPKQVVFYQLIFMGLTVSIVIRGISGGIEKASKFMMPGLFIILVFIALRSLTLENSRIGLKFLFFPDFSLLDMDLIMNALGQMFFSLSIGMGVMVTYGSYLDKKENIIDTALTIPLIDTLVALVSGLAIIPAVFSLGFEAGEGPGLMFITLPAVFASMPMGQVFCISFFVLVLFAALTSSISMLEVAISYFVDERKTRRKPTSLLVAFLIFLMGIPASLSLGERGRVLVGNIDFFSIYDKLTSNILLPTGGFLLAVFVGWVFTPERAIEEIESSGHKFRLKGVWSFLIKYIVPIAIFIVLINSYRDFITSLL